MTNACRQCQCVIPEGGHLCASCQRDELRRAGGSLSETTYPEWHGLSDARKIELVLAAGSDRR